MNIVQYFINTTGQSVASDTIQNTNLCNILVMQIYMYSDSEKLKQRIAGISPALHFVVSPAVL